MGRGQVVGPCGGVSISYARATLDAGHRVFVTINNKAEGSAPLSVIALAEALHEAG